MYQLEKFACLLAHKRVEAVRKLLKIRGKHLLAFPSYQETSVCLPLAENLLNLINKIQSFDLKKSVAFLLLILKEKNNFYLLEICIFL